MYTRAGSSPVLGTIKTLMMGLKLAKCFLTFGPPQIKRLYGFCPTSPPGTRTNEKAPLLGLFFLLNSLFGNLEILVVSLDPDEISASVHASDAS